MIFRKEYERIGGKVNNGTPAIVSEGLWSGKAKFGEAGIGAADNLGAALTFSGAYFG